MAETSVKVGDGSKKNKLSKWQFALIFVAVIVAAGGAGLGLRWLQQYRDHKLATKPDAIQLKADEVQDLALSGDSDKAHKALDEALDNPELSPDGKYRLLFQEGITYENEKKYDEAISSYKEAEAINATQAVAEAIARTAEAKGDKELAIAYYKKAISLVDSKSNPQAEDVKSFYEQSIVNLGGEL